MGFFDLLSRAFGRSDAPEDRIKKRILELKGMGHSEDEVTDIIRQEFRLRFETYTPAGRELGNASIVESSPEMKARVDAAMDDAKANYQRHLASDPKLKAQVDAHKAAQNERARARRAKGTP